MTRRRGWLFAAFFAAPACFGTAAAEAVPPECSRYLGNWSGAWSLGFYGTQRLHVTHVSAQCVATLAYSPTEALPQSASQVPIQDGVMTFRCSVPGSSCRLEVKEDELHLTVTTPSGFVNTGVFRREP
jgi:hypothetical protein